MITYMCMLVVLYACISSLRMSVTASSLRTKQAHVKFWHGSKGERRCWSGCKVSHACRCNCRPPISNGMICHLLLHTFHNAPASFSGVQGASHAGSGFRGQPACQGKSRFLYLVKREHPLSPRTVWGMVACVMFLAWEQALMKVELRNSEQGLFSWLVPGEQLHLS